MMHNFDSLIQQGNALRGSELGAPKFSLWANDVRAAVQPYGESTAKILEHALQAGVIRIGGPNLNDDKINDTIELLESLKERTPEDSRAQDALINQKRAEAKATLGHKFSNVTVKGDATFGDGSPITKITIGEFMAALIEEVETMPEGEERTRILDSLKAVVANPTFAAVSGAVLSEVIKRLVSSPA